jgi:hypothetical protein
MDTGLADNPLFFQLILTDEIIHPVPAQPGLDGRLFKIPTIPGQKGLKIAGFDVVKGLGSIVFKIKERVLRTIRNRCN